MFTYGVTPWKACINMKSAICITAYQELNYLKKLVQEYSKEFDVFIHIDSKTKCDLSAFNSIDHVYAVQKYRVNWGSYTHILAACELIKLALKEGNEYISIISANTVPAVSVLALKDFFEKNRKTVFMEIKGKNESNSYYEFEYRYTAYYFQHIFNFRGRFGGIYLNFNKISSYIQRKFFPRKNCCFDYKGYLYCHMPSDVAAHCLDYIANNPEYIKQLKYCWIGEEFFFQNIIMNSKYNNNVIKDCLIFDTWPLNEGVSDLKITDYDKIVNSHKVFCRKVPEKSQELYFEKLAVRNNLYEN